MKIKKIYIKKFIFVLICCLTFFIFYYIFKNIGNNIFKQKSEDIIVENIINQYINYEANIEVKVIGNKTENVYTIYQKVKDNNSYFIVKELSLEVFLENNRLIAKENNLNLERMIDISDKDKLLNNNYFLNVFVEEYNDLKINREIKENSINEIIIILDVNKNTYCSSKILYIDKNTKKPIKLIIKDNQENDRIIILYNDIKIN